MKFALTLNKIRKYANEHTQKINFSNCDRKKLFAGKYLTRALQVMCLNGENNELNARWQLFVAQKFKKLKIDWHNANRRLVKITDKHTHTHRCFMCFTHLSLTRVAEPNDCVSAQLISSLVTMRTCICVSARAKCIGMWFGTPPHLLSLSFWIGMGSLLSAPSVRQIRLILAVRSNHMKTKASIWHLSASKWEKELTSKWNRQFLFFQIDIWFIFPINFLGESIQFCFLYIQGPRIKNCNFFNV